MKVQNQLIDKKYVHKNLTKNVMIADIRRKLPLKIDIHVFEDDVIGRLSQDEGEYLKAFYHLNTGPDFTSCYVLRSAGAGIRKHMEGYVQNGRPDNGHVNYVKQVLESENSCLPAGSGCVFHDICSEFTEQRILDILGLHHLMVGLNDRMNIYNLLKKAEYPYWTENIYYAQMHVDTKHDFFFEHANEHLPGLMLIEAVRQFGLACSHLFTNVPMKGIHFILSEIGVQYKGYLELHLPIMFEGRLRNADYNRSGLITLADFATSVYQNNREMVITNVIGKYLDNSLYTILRKANQSDLSDHKIPA
jgi:hypothetical protein